MFKHTILRGGLLPLALMTLLWSGLANATVHINEVLGSTTSTDTEFIELYNDGPTAIDLTDWTITLYDSDSGTSFGGIDGGSPHTIAAGSSVASGGFFLLGNPEFEALFGITPDASLPANAIENSSYTMVLADASSTIQQTVFVTDGGAGDAANIAGTVISPDLTVGPDGTFLPAGFFRTTDGGPTTGLLEFSPRPASSATPGLSNVPEPGTVLLMGLGLAGLASIERKRP